MSEYRGPVADWTFVAEADLRNYRYHIVKHGTNDGTVGLATAAAGQVGILQNAPNLGEQAEVRIFGGSKLYIDGTTDVGAGDGLVADSSGHGVKNSADKARIVGWAMHPETDAGPYLWEVFINVQTQSV
jgi:hypothetical protein